MLPAAEIVLVPSTELDEELHGEILALCSAAYEEDFTEYLALLAEGVHILARADGALVAHAAWVERELRIGDDKRPLRAAYIEAVATAPHLQSRGLGRQVMGAIPPHLSGFDIAALSPSSAAYYERLGWELWRGPLAYREGDAIVDTPEEQVMILRLPRTPPDLDLSARMEVDWRPVEVW